MSICGRSLAGIWFSHRRNDAPDRAPVSEFPAPSATLPWSARLTVSGPAPSQSRAAKRRPGHSQVHELQLQPDVSDISHPALVDPDQCHAVRQIGIHRPGVIRVRCGHHELPPPQAKQIVLAHESGTADQRQLARPFQQNGRRALAVEIAPQD
jgi:hypothetical protein